MLINHSTDCPVSLFRSGDQGDVIVDDKMYWCACACGCRHFHLDRVHSSHVLVWNVRLSLVYRMSEDEQDENEKHAKQRNRQ